MKIPITAEIRTYALSVAQVGERMRITGNKFGDVTKQRFSNLGDFKRVKAEYETLLGEFESQKETLENLTAPTQLRDEHEKLIQGYGKYVEATAIALHSLDAEKATADEESFNRGLKLQGEASKEIVKVSNDIAAKLGLI